MIKFFIFGFDAAGFEIFHFPLPVRPKESGEI